MDSNKKPEYNPCKNYEDSLQKTIDEAVKKKEDYHCFLNELRTEERFQTYFQNFKPDSVEQFMCSYANYKAHWLSRIESIDNMKDLVGLTFKKSANEVLSQILQKKLFDLQCLWRAEQISLPGVQCSADLLDWQYDIFNCPFIDLITQREIDIYIAYMQSNNYDDGEMFFGWQEYENIKGYYNDPDDEGEDSPDWYIFYDNQTGGNKGLLILPDIRGEKEDKYITLAIQESHKKMAEKSAKTPKDPRPFLPSTMDHPFTRKFLAEVDGDQQALIAFDMWVESGFNPKANEFKDDAALAYEVMSYFDEPFPNIGEFSDWRISMMLTYKAFKRKKTIDMLPNVYEE